MKRLLQLTNNLKHRNLLHIIGGGLIALLPNIFAPKGLGFLLGIWLCVLIANIWELQQVKHYKAKYSYCDIFLTLIGGVIIGILL